ncbi:hypothetical protein TNCV_2858381 [Trichonephila clavipes]|nr:hypothetical protein TNCV_2858381 [Trichonephila clavipes]
MQAKLRWIDGLEKYLPVLRTKNWRTQEGRRLACKRLLQKAKAQTWDIEPLRKEGISYPMAYISRGWALRQTRSTGGPPRHFGGTV